MSSHNTTICEQCGYTLAIGDWPICPHGSTSGTGVHMIDDVLPGGPRYVHNMGHEPVWIETKTQYRQELAARGLKQTERATYNHDDQSPWATRTRLRPGAIDPFVAKPTRELSAPLVDERGRIVGRTGG